jgi:RNA polymerase sigma-70 factor (ECF subfamily)
MMLALRGFAFHPNQHGAPGFIPGSGGTKRGRCVVILHRRPPRPPEAGLGDVEGRDEFRGRAVACLDGLYAFALSLCRDRATAEDLVQETYVRALRALRKPEPHESLRPWLFTILHNVWRNQRRRPAPVSLEEFAAAGSLPDGGPDPGESLDREAAAERVREAIAALPEAFREVVMLRFAEGFSYQEIAAVLSCPAGTVMSRLARARALIRRALAPSSGEGRA